MLKGTKALFALILTAGFISNTTYAEPGSPDNNCDAKKAQILQAFSEQTAAVEQAASEKASRAENIRNKKLEALDAKSTRLNGIVESKFQSCLERTNNEERCTALKEKALERIRKYVEKTTANIQRVFEKILGRIESWLKHKLDSLENRKNEALRKLEQRCGPGYGPDDVVVVTGDQVPV